MCGCFFEISEYSGNCLLKRMDGPGAGCGQAASFSPNTSDNLVNNWYYQRDEWNHDHDQAVAQVHPGSVQITAWNTHTSLHASQAFQSGWNCTGYARVTIKYLVFQGTTPP